MSSFKWNWDDFDPKVVQTDKRDREGAVAKGTKMVMKNLNELGLSSFVAVPVVDRNRTIENIVHVFPPNSPLEAFFMNKDNRQFVRGLDKALTDTQMWALELWDLKEVMEEDIEARKKFEEMTGMEDENDEDEAGDEAPLKKPCKPIFTMTAEEISVYFGCLLKELYKLEGIEKFKLWAKKKDNEVLAKATALKVYDTKAEEILARDEYIGRGSGGQNIGNKLKIVSAYLLQKYEIDHNTFAESVPSNYQKIRINFDDYEELVSTKNIRNKTVKSRVAKATKTKIKAAERRPATTEDSSDDEETPRPKKSRPTPRPSTSVSLSRPPPSLSRPTPRPSTTVRTPAHGLLGILRRENREQSPGTPFEKDTENSEDDEEDDEEDPLVYKDIDLVKPGNVIKAHAGLITTVNVFDIEVCAMNGFYRASISDGENLSNKVIFNSKLNERIESELMGEGKVTTIKLEVVDILDKVLVGVMQYTVIEEGPTHVGEARYVGSDFYRQLKPRGCFTPSRFKKKQLFK